MTEQYLILHKVRGAPQYDIAEKAMIGNEEGWVLCTCGHRAYPYRVITKMLELGKDDLDEPKFENWPEHYPQRPEPKLKIDISSILGSFVNFKRRM
jgi:hypothetical protein